MSTISTKILRRIATWVGAIVLAVLALFVLFVGLNRAVPYQPFVVQNYFVQPSVVCAGGDVHATIIRRFTRQVKEFNISETWVISSNNSRVNGKPVDSNQGNLPPSILQPSDTFKHAQSPLINKAPSVAGQYKIRIATHAEGFRFGLKTSGEEQFYSSNVITVRDCK